MNKVTVFYNQYSEGYNINFFATKKAATEKLNDYGYIGSCYKFKAVEMEVDPNYVDRVYLSDAKMYLNDYLSKKD